MHFHVVLGVGGSSREIVVVVFVVDIVSLVRKHRINRETEPDKVYGAMLS